MHYVESMGGNDTQRNIKLFTSQWFISAIYSGPSMKLAPSEIYHIYYEWTWYTFIWTWWCCKEVGSMSWPVRYAWVFPHHPTEGWSASLKLLSRWTSPQSQSLMTPYTRANTQTLLPDLAPTGTFFTHILQSHTLMRSSVVCAAPKFQYMNVEESPDQLR